MYNDRNDSIVFLVSTGFTLSEVAFMYNLTHESVRLICKSSGILVSSDKWKLNNLKLRFGEALVENKAKSFYKKQTTKNKKLLYNEFKDELDALGVIVYKTNIGQCEELYKAGTTPLEISNKLNTTRGNVYHLLNKLGYKKKLTKKKYENRNKKIIEMKNNGHKTKDIANKFKLTMQRIQQIK